MARVGSFSGATAHPFGIGVAIDDLYRLNSAPAGIVETPGPPAPPVTPPPGQVPNPTPPPVTPPPLPVITPPVPPHSGGTLGNLLSGNPLPNLVPPIATPILPPILSGFIAGLTPPPVPAGSSPQSGLFGPPPKAPTPAPTAPVIPAAQPPGPLALPNVYSGTNGTLPKPAKPIGSLSGLFGSIFNRNG